MWSDPLQVTQHRPQGATHICLLTAVLYWFFFFLLFWVDFWACYRELMQHFFDSVCPHHNQREERKWLVPTRCVDAASRRCIREVLCTLAPLLPLTQNGLWPGLLDPMCLSFPISTERLGRQWGREAASVAPGGVEGGVEWLGSSGNNKWRMWFWKLPFIFKELPSHRLVPRCGWKWEFSGPNPGA